MRKVLEAKDVTPVQQSILRAVVSSAKDHPSRLTATGPTVLLRQILTIEDNENKEDYKIAMIGLVSARWIIGISKNPNSGLASYRLSHTADLYIRKLDSKMVSKEMARSHA